MQIGQSCEADRTCVHCEKALARSSTGTEIGEIGVGVE